MKKLNPGEVWLEILECPDHGFLGVSVSGNDLGRRITPSKCCGRFRTKKRWRFVADELSREFDLSLREALE